jgi:transposase
LIRQRSSLISAIRAHFAEFGIVAGQWMRNIERLLELLDKASDARLPTLARDMLDHHVREAVVGWGGPPRSVG